MPSILIADADAGVRHFLRSLLTGAGHEVAEAINSKDALSLLREAVFDLVIIDMVMQEHEGFETLRQLRRDHPVLKIVVTCGSFKDAKFGEVLLRMAGALGARGTLDKPLNTDAVLETVQRVLDSQ
jgi:CheY-like chemotaxis protein